MLVIMLLLLVAVALSGGMSFVFFRLARAEASHTHRFVVQTTWSGFFQGLCIGLLNATAIAYVEYLTKWGCK